MTYDNDQDCGCFKCLQSRAEKAYAEQIRHAQEIDALIRENSEPLPTCSNGN